MTGPLSAISVEALLPTHLGHLVRKQLPVDRPVFDICSAAVLRARDGSTITTRGYPKDCGYPNIRAVLDPDSVYGDPDAVGFADILASDGSPHPLCMRSVLKETTSKFQPMSPLVGSELEFFLLPWDETSDGEIVPGRSLYSTGLIPTEAEKRFRHAVFERTGQLGIEIGGVWREFETGQYEVTTAPKPLLVAADEVVLVREVVYWAARAAGLRALFIPQLEKGQHGCGLHISISASTLDEQAWKERSCRLVSALSEVALLWAPSVNSYRRLQNSEFQSLSPGPSWDRRDSWVRVVTTPDDKPSRCEVRLPDASANPYLAIAAIAQLFLASLADQASSTTEMDSVSLPGSLAEAIERFKACDWLPSVFSPDVIELVSEAASREIAVYAATPTNVDWNLHDAYTT